MARYLIISSDNEDQKIKDVLADGKSVGAVRTYKFDNIATNHVNEWQINDTGTWITDEIG